MVSLPCETSVTCHILCDPFYSQNRKAAGISGIPATNLLVSQGTAEDTGLKFILILLRHRFPFLHEVRGGHSEEFHDHLDAVFGHFSEPFRVVRVNPRNRRSDARELPD